MEIYSPFVNEEKEFLRISDVKYSDLEQLNALEEGYQLEFKRNFNENVKKKIPSIMSSYANSSGGWIVIGIDDKSKDIIPIRKERNDFGQIISQLIKGCLTPIPLYDVRFISCPDNLEMGVLLIYVHEGNVPPYISNGTIYIRNGSSKEPVQRADRATIEFLFNKSNRYRNKIKDFFKRDIYFPYNDEINKKRQYSLCNIYLKNVSDVKIFQTYKEQENIMSFIKHNNTQIFKSVQFGLNSILFKHESITPFKNQITMIYELFNDASAKFYIPFSNIDEKYPIEKNFSGCNYEDKNTNYRILNGVITVDSIRAVLTRHIHLLEKNNISISNLVLQMECEDIENTVLYFNSPLYFKYIEEDGLCYSLMEKAKTMIIYLKDCKNLDYDNFASSVAFELFSVIFGFHPEKIKEIYFEAQEYEYADFYAKIDD